MSATRLDRLVTLLETGHNAHIRNIACQQLADIQKSHPDELFNLLLRVVKFLQSPSWDTRAAAAKAIGGIVENATKYDPNEDDSEDVEPKKEENGTNGNGTSHGSDDQLLFDSLDIGAILEHGVKLSATAGKEYDYKFVGLSPLERLVAQKKTLKSRLGLNGKYIEEEFQSLPDGTGNQKPLRLDTSLSMLQKSDSYPMVGSPQEVETPGGEDAAGGMSSRQLNMLKRKKKKELKTQANKVRVIDFSDRKGSIGGEVPETPLTARPVAVKQESNGHDGENGVADYFSLERRESDDDSKLVKEFKGEPVPEKSFLATEAEEDGSEWPFERLCDFLAIDLFDHNWEIRHGAAMGLREILRVHGAGAGRRRGKSLAANNRLNECWLENIAFRICSVFLLDRYNDFSSDTVVAPVRENCGQALAATLKFMSPEGVKTVFRALRQISQSEDTTSNSWQPKHGGRIGLRYLVSTRDELLHTEPEFLDGILDCAMQGLLHPDDDIRAVSAATLTPIVKDIVTSRPSVLSSLVLNVWNSIQGLTDDLTASTGHIMDLLAKLCTFPEVLEAMKQNAADEDNSFSNLVPRLYPFFRHTITTVRSAVLRALITFLAIDDPSTKGWLSTLCLRLVYQNILLERNDGVLKLSLEVWQTMIDDLVRSGGLVEQLDSITLPLVTLTMHPIGIPRHPIPMEASLFLKPSGEPFAQSVSARRISPSNGAGPEKKKRNKKNGRDSNGPETKPTWSSTSHNIDGPAMEGDLDLIGADVILRNRLAAAKALGKAVAAWPAATRSDTFSQTISSHLKSTYASTQLIASLVIEEYGKHATEADALSARFTEALRPIVENDRPGYYTDLCSYLHIARAQCQGLLHVFRDSAHVSNSKLPVMAAVVQGDENASQYAFGIADAEKIVNVDYERLKKSLTPAQRVAALQLLEDNKMSANTAIQEAKEAKDKRDVRIRAAAAAATVALKELPKKPALTIRAIMDSVKTEDNFDLQTRSAAAIAILVQHMVGIGKRVVADKVVGNLVKFYCSETAETPEFPAHARVTDSILSLRKEEDIRDHADAARFEREARAARIMRRGSKDALDQLVLAFGNELFEKLPSLRNIIETPLQRAFAADELPVDIESFGQEVVDSLSTLRALVPNFHADLKPFVLEILPNVAKALRSRLAVLRYMAAKCFSTICRVMSVEGITALVENVLPSIGNPMDVFYRQGAIECVYHLIHVMEDAILPYVIFLIVPVLGRMSDSNNDVRLLAATSFATLVKLVPLEAGIPDPPGFTEEMLKGRERERKFIGQMLDPKKAEDFKIPVAIKADLRPYQQDGVNWLAFLNRYNLHGILCDDMGLGKTLQTLCIVASDHHLRAEKFKQTGDVDSRRLPSLIVCPPTLSGHWQQEIAQFAPFLKAVSYTGPSAERAKVRHLLADADIVITSYEVCRNDIAVLNSINYNYCVLDEGHLIKNSKAKLSLAVKSLQSYHRLILSGTPIQNNVLELWSLFDFLMPGFLGSEKVFQDRFAKPIAASRNAKSSSKEQEAGALAIEALHKQVLPFLLRRLKEEVLNDLPPKILQNYYCDLSELQRKLFDDFGRQQKSKVAAASSDKSTEGQRHIFQALQYMRKLCNSPALVVKESHPQYEPLTQQLAAKKSSLTDIAHAPKLTALRDLLVDCGIGVADTMPKDSYNVAEQGAVSQHRALVFCQMKEMLDMVQNQVLAKLLPSVQFLRLDGSVEANRRQDIVNRFNTDPSYDVLLLTTSVGGLGLNLTGADTVIFVEHDWNPQKDMQAMDRAHRIGQKKVVNVYRIVTRGTLEEKILSLQRFKIDVASTVVNQQNAALGSMETDQLLDLFDVSASSAEGVPALPDAASAANVNAGISEEDAVNAEGAIRKKGETHMLDGMEALWDEKQYEEEYNLDSFLKSMKGA